MRFLLAILLLLLAAPAFAQSQGQGMSKAVVVSSCGGGAATSGALNQLTMDTTGRLCQSGIGSGVCPQAAAYLARTVGGNEGGNAVNITALICGLVSDGVITGDLLTGKCGSHLDALYILAQQNTTDSLLNVCGTNYSLLLISGGSFTAYLGYNLTTFDTGFNPITATSPNYTQNSASFGFFISVFFTEPIPQMGNDVSSALYDCYTGSLFYARVNNATIGSVPSACATGLYVGDREGSTGVNPFYNGVDKGSQAGTSGAPVSHTFYVGSAPSGSNAAETLSEAFIAGSLGAALELATYTRIRTYNTAVGIP